MLHCVKNRIHKRVQRLQFSIKELKLWRYGSMLLDI